LEGKGRGVLRVQEEGGARPRVIVAQQSHTSVG